MKGMVFTELMAMAEQAIGEEAVDDILDTLELENDGAYSAVGNYPCSELMRIVGAISDQTTIPVPDLQRQFGRWIHSRFVESDPGFFKGKDNVLVMLDAIENEVHVEVRKLYPDAELPTFETEWQGDKALKMTYSSDRPLVPFCHGMIEACVAHFGAPAEISVLDNAETGNENTAQFLIRLTG
ncbi:heme NO-binding domain-containing protein [Phaeobacter sp. J2-8]|uniref:heme NO-binding domain-containing protein n=1 Tax=Phaeobacter sp. J2-8 TaxID=2931394 RepID=UPI001FD030CD|nr:heme NO-binding domain-containing protein [Phaeobacter sp. J2-8]MCJ7873162.1 heme NO-binding domain-containing protein [Phaeobacter sp. J2-8]